MRIPRWDWMDPRIAQDGLPTILLNETMDVVNPARPMGPKITLHNPFHSYKLQASPYLSMPRDNTVYSEKLYNELHELRVRSLRRLGAPARASLAAAQAEFAKAQLAASAGSPPAPAR